jgi:hypothetical protein
MPSSLAIATLMALLAAPALARACELRFGYTDKNASPYYLGSGDTVPEAPGASIALLREMNAHVGCALTLVRLPTARLALATESGAIDASLLATPPISSPRVAFPLDKLGRPDPQRALQQFTMIYARAADVRAGDIDPAAFLRKRRVGVSHGVSFTGALRQAGYQVDDGASDAQHNFDKLRRRRVDAVAISLVAPGDLDAMLAARFGGELTRLEQPLQTSSLWLMVNQDYYLRHRAAVDAMWNWVGTTGRQRFPQLLKRGDKPASTP